MNITSSASRNSLIQSGSIVPAPGRPAPVKTAPTLVLSRLNAIITRRNTFHAQPSKGK